MYIQQDFPWALCLHNSPHKLAKLLNQECLRPQRMKRAPKGVSSDQARSAIEHQGLARHVA